MSGDIDVACAGLFAASDGSGDPLYTIHSPPAYAMIGDLLIARSLLVVATVIDAGQALVVDPAKAAFVRCLGV
ncbi:hypothetical protein [Pseudomonas putida]|uniref:hypothetical protein n=1 Tax=Pseudomonas putida TaxID=303 RepID=UPI003D982CA9